MLAYSAVFGACVVLARTVPGRWPAVLGGVVLAAVVVCGYALLTKVFPDQLDAGDIYARLRAPYSYWNAIGLTAAMGAIGCMWLGARRAGHALLSALAYPAMGLMLLTMMLAYSRGALVALVLGLALWFCIVPLRLRGAAVLISGAIAAGGVIAWDFSRHALNSDNISLAARTSAGHQLGVLIALMLVLLTLAGLAIGFWTSRQAPSIINRRRAGALLLSLVLVVIVAFAGALAASHRGFTGSISHGLHSLTDPHAAIPPNTPGRLTAVGSVRARYWNEALKVFKAHPVLGAGAEGYATARLRYRTETLDVRHAHGYVVQTLADLGIVGLALTLALLVAWMAAAGRSTHPLNRRWTSWRTLRDWVSRRAMDGARPGWRRLTVGGEPAPLHARAHRHAEHALPGRRVRHPLAGRLDVVRARERLRGAALRRLAGGSRPARGELIPCALAGAHGLGGAAPKRRRAGAEPCAAARRAQSARAPAPARAGPAAARRGAGRAGRSAAGRLGAVAAAALGRRRPAGARAARARPARRAPVGADGASRAIRCRRRRCSRCRPCSRRRASRRSRAPRSSGRCACSRPTRRRG